VGIVGCLYVNSQCTSIDPAIGKAAGFGGVILHGLSTFGFAARALLTVVANGDAKALKFFGVRFTSPVKPGDALETQIWEIGPGPDGTTEVTFITKNLATGKVSHIMMPVFYQDLCNICL
jgi:peroxisomal enoyl-CoA hydratase 2